MEFKGTKGEWDIDNFSLYRGEEMIIDDDGRYIASIIERVSEEETDANSRLIAAAPQLLETLKAVLTAIDTHLEGKGVNWIHFQNEARETINKALCHE